MDLRKLVPFLLPALLAFSASPSRAEDAAFLASVKSDERAANGDCLPGFSGEPEDVLAAGRIALARVNGSPVEMPITYAIARIVYVMGKIGSGEFNSHHALNILVNSAWSFTGPTGLDPDRIVLRPTLEGRMPLRDTRNGGVNNYGMLAEEIADMVAKRTGLDLQYAQAVPSPCEVSVASVRDRRTEFNEVFAAYVTNPELLYRKTVACEAARLFMAKRIFKESPVRATSCRARFKSLGRDK